MSEVIRQSPIIFEQKAAEKTNSLGWEVVLKLEGEGDGPWLVDLSHLQRWDCQDIELDSMAPFGLGVPVEPGQAFLQDDKLIARMNRTQAMITCLGTGDSIETPTAMGYTDITDAHCMLAVVGSETPGVMEHVSNLDLFKPGREMPFLTQGPVMHIPCQVVTLSEECVLMSFSRGYGQSFADAMLHAASGCDLRPGGEGVFNERFLQIQSP
jgi:hypothetical protein